MKNQALLVIVLLVVTGVGSYLLGSKLNPNKPRLIYIPGKNSSSIEKPSFLTKGSLTFTTGGKVKNKTTDSITIGDNNNEAVFKIDKNVSIFKRASESNEKSSST
ncbi:MAG: hypothetical protein M1450_02105, partial [Patescibacteria group bacterium]|nr:hypothetical protein [Patescibacteria group bacterium]